MTRDLLNLLAQLLHQPALADRRDQRRDQRALRLAAALAGLERALGRAQQLGDRQRLLDEVEGAEPRRLDRGLDRAVAGENDDRAAQRMLLVPFAQQRDAVHVGHPDVEQHEVGLLARGRAARGGRVGRDLDLVALLREDLGEQSPDIGLVIDDENSRRSHAFSLLASARRASRAAAGNTMRIARAALRARCRPRPAAVLLDDPAHDREPEAGALRLRGHVRVERLLEQAVLETGPVVDDGQRDLVARALRLDHDDRILPPVERLERVRQQVVEELADTPGIGLEQRGLGVERKAERHARVLRVVQVRHLPDSTTRSSSLMCISGAFAYSEKAATICFIASTCWTIVCVERSSSSASVAPRPAHQLAAHALGRELDRRERVPDLVREAARDLAPGRLALRLQELRDLVEHQHEALCARIARQRGAGADQLAPARRRSAASPARATRSRRPRRAAAALRGAPRAAAARPRFPRAAGPQHPSKSTPRMVPAAWFATRTRRSGSSEMTPLVSRARITASAARSASTAARLRSVSSRARASFLVMSLNEVTRKPISSCDGRAMPRVEVAFRHRARARDQVLHRPHQPLGEIQGAVHRREQRHQQHQRERQHEGGLERLAQVTRAGRTAGRPAARSRRGRKAAAAPG